MNKTIKKKYLLFTSILILVVFIISSCNTKVKNPTEHLLIEKIKKRGKLIALTGYNAYSYFVYKGKIMGYEYELLNRFAKKLGVDVEIRISKDINEMFELLENGEGDLIAFNLTVTNGRKQLVDFTKHFNTTHQVLVQRKPKNWRQQTVDKTNKSLIKNIIDLENKTVYVRNGSSYETRIENLAEEIGSYINIVVAEDSVSTEDLIEQVAEGKIDYTISDENIARLNKAYYTNLDISTEISFPQKIAWAVKKGSISFLGELNTWIDEFKKEVDYYVIYDRYYKYRSYYKARRSSKYFLNEGGGISPYDELIKKHTGTIDWNWLLLVSLVYQESNFNPDAKSWAGAVGLMQLLPETGYENGAENLYDPEQNIKAGVSYIKWLDKYWSKKITDKKERIKFILASYNIGFGHIDDARKLAKKYNSDDNIWEDNVEYYLLKKSKEKFYNDDVVLNGYCNGKETVNYVKNVLHRYDIYSQFLK